MRISATLASYSVLGLSCVLIVKKTFVWFSPLNLCLKSVLTLRPARPREERTPTEKAEWRHSILFYLCSSSCSKSKLSQLKDSTSYLNPLQCTFKLTAVQLMESLQHSKAFFFSFLNSEYLIYTSRFAFIAFQLAFLVKQQKKLPSMEMLVLL